MHNTFVNMVHDTFVELVHDILTCLVCITHLHIWCKTEEMGARNVPNVRGGFVAQKMTNVVGAYSVHGFLQLGKLWTTTWARPINFDLHIDMWAKDGGFLDGQNLIRVFTVRHF